MELIINTQLEPSFEILGLLLMHHHPKFLELSYFTEQAAELGVNAEELYKKHGPLLKRYVAEFEKKLVLEEGDSAFFEDEDATFLIFLQVLFAEVPHWIDRVEGIPEAEIHSTLLEGIEEWLSIEVTQGAPVNEIIAALEQSGLSANVCWKVMLLLQKPKQHIQRLAQIIRRNTPAYQSAIKAIEKPLQRRLAQFVKLQQEMPERKSRQRIMEIAGQLEELPIIRAVTPTLIHPMLEIMTEGTRYVGLFIDDVYQMLENLQKARSGNNPVFKALGDSSKFDILLSLNHTPKYNLELAEHLGLTAATISHHMQSLLLHGLVSVEKRDGRVYYTLQRDTLKSAITQLSRIFLCLLSFV